MIITNRELARRFGAKLKQWTWEDGTVYDVRLSKKDGKFAVHIPREETILESDTLDQLEKDWKKRMQEFRPIDWKPIIFVEVNCPESDGVLGFRFDRYFQTKKSDGTFMYSHYNVSATDKEIVLTTDDHDERNEVLHGEPGSKTRIWYTGGYMSYTPERWKALVLIEKEILRVGEKLKEILGGDFEDVDEDNPAEQKAIDFIDGIAENKMKALPLFTEKEGD